jgi:membrane fusion protein, heavy metal efflux system
MAGEVKRRLSFKKILFIDKDDRRTGYSIYAIILFCLIGFFISFLFFSRKAKRNKLRPIGDFSKSFHYKSDTVKLLEPESELNLAGKISFDENNIVRVFSIVSGHVEEVKVALGTLVFKGQELASIKSGDISQILSDYRTAKDNYEISKKNLKVTESLYKSKFSSQVELITARKEFDKSEDELKKASEILKLYEANPKIALPYYYVKSPVDGYVVERHVNINMQIRADNNDNLFTISDLKKVWINAIVFEDDISKVKEGLQATVTTMVYPDQEFNGIINNISKVLDPASRALRIRIVIDNELGLLKPEMFASVKIHLPEKGKLLAIDPKALVFDKDNYWVVRKINNDLLIKQVKVNRKTSKYAFLENGLNPGDIVVTEGSLLVYNEIANNYKK